MRRPTIVIAERRGGLGNRLLLFAHVLAFARSLNYVVRFPAFLEHQPLFVGDDSLEIAPVLPQSIRRLSAPLAGVARVLSASPVDLPRTASLRARWGETIDLSGDGLCEDLQNKSLVLLHGWGIRAYADFCDQREWLRGYFRLMPSIRRQVSERLQGSSSRAANVGVHIRQGDYRTHLGGRFFFQSSEYCEVMRRVCDLLTPRRVRFHIFSDQPQEASEFSPFEVVIGAGQPVVDMYSLAQCELIVGPPSSFSWWASFIGGTPLYMVGSADDVITLDRFQVAPAAHSAEFAALYW